jgi:fatty acid desaturase
MSAATLPGTAEELLAAITDPNEPGAPNAFERAVDRLSKPYLVNPNDVVFTRLIARVFTQVFPLAIGLYLLPGWWALALGVPYLAYIYARFAGPIMLGLHAVTHRPLFRKPIRGARRLITHLFPPFWGLTPFAYKVHHVLMHHTENNGDDDLSGTAEYERDNIVHFIHYWFRFFAFGYLHLGSWMLRKDRKGLALLLIGDSICWVGMIALALWKPAATIVVFFLPFLLMRYFMMAGNWTEHAFVDPDAPTNSYTNSTCLINTVYNHRCYNAGYHLVHHIVPGRHWSDTVSAFEKYLPNMIKEDSILFFGVRNNQVIWWKLMLGDYDFLAERLLDLGNRRPGHDEKVAFLKHRAQARRGSLKGLVERREAIAMAA